GDPPQPVSDHVLRHVDGDELPPVVHGQSVPHELRRDGGAARPGLQHLLLALAVELLDPLLQPLVDVRPLLGRSSHGLPLLLRPARHDVAVRGARAAPGLVPLPPLSPPLPPLAPPPASPREARVGAPRPAPPPPPRGGRGVSSGARAGGAGAPASARVPPCRWRCSHGRGCRPAPP